MAESTDLEQEQPKGKSTWRSVMESAHKALQAIHLQSGPTGEYRHNDWRSPAAGMEAPSIADKLPAEQPAKEQSKTTPAPPPANISK